MLEKERHWCPKYITTSFVADRCGVSAVTVLSWIDEKRLCRWGNGSGQRESKRP